MKHPDEPLKRALLVQTRIQAEALYLKELAGMVDDDTICVDVTAAVADLARAYHHVDDVVNRLRLAHNT